MIRISKFAGQSALAMAFMAQDDHPDRPIRAREVAKHLHIPTDSALKIMQALARTALIESRLGRSGGYLLGRAADSISLLEVYEAVDGPLRANLAVEEPRPELAGQLALLQRVADESIVHMRQRLADVTVADLIATSAVSEASTGPVAQPEAEPVTDTSD